MTRQGINRFRDLLLVLALTFVCATANASMHVELSDVSDGNGLPTLFTGGYTQSPGQGEVITLGLLNFMADGSSAISQFAVDTLFMTITAPTGFVINSITYSETGEGNVNDGFAAATGSMVVDGMAKNFLTQLFLPGDGANGWSITPATVAIANKESIDMSISNSLLAFLFGAGPATIQKNSATITVGLTAIPLPPAIWLMGAAVAALVSVRRRDAS